MGQPSVLGIISYKVFPAQMGGQKGVANFYSHLSSHTKVVLAVARENTVIPEGNGPAKIHPFLYHHRWGVANLLYVFRLRKLIKQENIDVVCIEHSYLGWLGILLRWVTGKPFVIRSHNIEAHRFRDMHKPFWRLYYIYEKWVHKQADHNFFVTAEDREWALLHYGLPAEKCSVSTYGTDTIAMPAPHQRTLCRNQLISENKLPNDTKLFLFNGTLDYLPNTDALRIIISELLPLLPSRFPFRLFVCGNRLTGKWQKVLAEYPGIIYKGFVDDISLYFQGADCFINPVTLGGGIKTKLVEALSYNQSCISTENGAKGIPAEVTGSKLQVVGDYDWPAFARCMQAQNAAGETDIPAAFYQMFNWDNIVRKALLSLPSK